MPEIAKQDNTAANRHPRLKRELKTIKAMIRLYCRDHHQRETSLCRQCQELQRYAAARLAGCPFQEKKPTCATCPVHCYKPALREQVRTVMRYAGPRMLLSHPLLAIAHLLDQLRPKPESPVRARKNVARKGD